MPGFLGQTWDLWTAGGWLMLPLFLLALFIYYTALDLLFWLRGHILLRPCEACGVPGLLLPLSRSNGDVIRHFDQLRNECLDAVNRRIRFLRILTGTAPLMGLLGTVTGMLSTFTGMAGQHSRPLDAVAGGISEALITTQTGLMIALPALVLTAMITRWRNRLAHSITQLERSSLRQVYREAA